MRHLFSESALGENRNGFHWSNLQRLQTLLLTHQLRRQLRDAPSINVDRKPGCTEMFAKVNRCVSGQGTHEADKLLP